MADIGNMPDGQINIGVDYGMGKVDIASDYDSAAQYLVDDAAAKGITLSKADALAIVVTNDLLGLGIDNKTIDKLFIDSPTLSPPKQTGSQEVIVVLTVAASNPWLSPVAAAVFSSVMLELASLMSQNKEAEGMMFAEVIVMQVDTAKDIAFLAMKIHEANAIKAFVQMGISAVNMAVSIASIGKMAKAEASGLDSAQLQSKTQQISMFQQAFTQGTGILEQGVTAGTELRLGALEYLKTLQENAKNSLEQLGSSLKEDISAYQQEIDKINEQIKSTYSRSQSGREFGG